MADGRSLLIGIIISVLGLMFSVLTAGAPGLWAIGIVVLLIGAIIAYYMGIRDDF